MSGILRLPAVLELTGLSRTTIWRMVKRGEFPQPVALGARARGWRASEVQEWMDSRQPVGKVAEEPAGAVAGGGLK